jgi:hypothetical protein
MMVVKDAIRVAAHVEAFNHMIVLVVLMVIKLLMVYVKSNAVMGLI